MNVSVLVAFRDSSPDQYRQRLWDFVRARLERDHPDFEIVVGTDDGEDPFNKCLALNRAAAMATGDVFYVLDSDSYCTPDNVTAAVAGIAATPRHWWRPWVQKVKLSDHATRELLSMDDWDGSITTQWHRSAENRNSYWAAPPLLLHRDLWNAVGGMDERFRGWGQEDDAFAWSLRALYGVAEVVPGRCVHLFHKRIGRSGRDLWPGQERTGTNVALAHEYRRAAKTPETMRELIAGRAG